MCDSLAYITIPSSVVAMIGNPFQIWHGILNNKSKAFIYEDCVLFNKDKTTLIVYRAKETNYTIPNGIIRIGDRAFDNCKFLTNINIPNSTTTIGNSAFSCCRSLISINIPEGITTIGNFAFSGCQSLTSINIPNSITTIGMYAFSGCRSLISINIPDGLTTIERGAFYRCNNIPSKIKSDIIQRFGEKVFK